MVYPTLISYNMSQGVHVLFCYVNDVTTSIFMYMTLLAIFCIVSFSAYFMQKSSSGIGDLPQCCMAGAFSTTVFAVLLRLVDCPYNSLVNGIALAICIVLTVLCWLWMSFTED